MSINGKVILLSEELKESFNNILLLKDSLINKMLESNFSSFNDNQIINFINDIKQIKQPLENCITNINHFLNNNDMLNNESLINNNNIIKTVILAWYLNLIH